MSYTIRWNLRPGLRVFRLASLDLLVVCRRKNKGGENCWCYPKQVRNGEPGFPGFTVSVLARKNLEIVK